MKRQQIYEIEQRNESILKARETKVRVRTAGRYIELEARVINLAGEKKKMDVSEIVSMIGVFALEAICILAVFL